MKQPSKSNIIYSSDDENDTKNSKVVSAKRKNFNAKPKSTATVTPKLAQHKSSPPPKNQAKPIQKPVSKPSVTNKSVKSTKSTVAAAAAAKLDTNKKKSIFSPENSSEESDSAANIKQTAIKTQLKNSAQKPRPKAAARPVVTSEKFKSSQTNKPIIKTEKIQVKTKMVVSSGSSASSSTETSSSSDSDSSTESVKKSAKKPVKKSVVKDQGSDSEVENQKDKQVSYNS